MFSLRWTLANLAVLANATRRWKASMTRDAIDDLRRRHPLLYDGLRSTESYPDGWERLVNRLADQIETMIAEQPEAERASLRSAKEKFGTLVYQLSGPTTEKMNLAVRAAIDLARETCQECGASGSMRVSSRQWYRVRCDEHARSDDSLLAKK